MQPRNCWEMKLCGRQPGGSRVEELGECPAAVAEYADGTNRGINGGRYCWAVTGTFSDGKTNGTFARKQISCMSCEVFKIVQLEEGDRFVLCKKGVGPIKKVFG